MAKKKVSLVKSYTLKNGEKRYEFPVYLGIDPLTGYTEAHNETWH
ncbi:hypothetical protein MHB48_08580 [Psychrobacillus sp. FSL H8-0483]